MLKHYHKPVMSGFILHDGKRVSGYYCKEPGCHEYTTMEKPCGLGHLPFSMWIKNEDGSAHCPRCGDMILAPSSGWLKATIREGKNIFTGV